jgi:adenylate cyclase, class 2
LLARPEGLEPPAYWFEASRSIRLSYGRVEPHRIILLAVAASDSHIENEVKVRLAGTPADVRAQIESRGYHIVQPRTLESDRLFDRAGELRHSDQLLRLRHHGDQSIITYKGPTHAGHHKNREEIEFDVSDGAAAEHVLERLGYQVAFRYEKYRTTLAAGGEPGVITIDETPMGVFVELEGPPEWVDQTAARLGLSPAQYLTASYARLYQEYRRANPGAPADMVFGEPGVL